MLKVKLFLHGKRNQRTYRIVVAEARSKRGGNFTDSIGWWNPQLKKLTLNKEKLDQWQKKGAQLTVGVRKILQQWKSS